MRTLPACARKRPVDRRGAAAVEFAVVAPILFTAILGIMEFGRGMMVAEMLNNAARAGCRVATLGGATTASVNSAAQSALDGINGATITATVNGNAANVSTAASGDTVAVSITVPYSSVSWLAKASFLGGTTLSGKTSMIHE